MDEFDLDVPDRILESLPDEDEAARRDMRRAVDGLEARLNEAVASAADEREAAGRVVEAIERLEDHLERYDEFVPELRAWGQSPIYAIAWRNLQAELITQIQAVGWVAERIDRERSFRAVEDGIRLRDR